MSGPCTGHAAESDEWMASILERLHYHACDKNNTAFARSTMFEAADYIRSEVVPAPAPDQLDDTNVADMVQATDATQETAPAPAEVPVPEPLAAQHRFRHPEKIMPGWSIWQPCIVRSRPAREIDSAGYQVEYRTLFTQDQMRTYGDAREAAGYARGLKENSAGNETLAHELDLVLSDDGVTLTPGAFRALTFVRAALRGEVK